MNKRLIGVAVAAVLSACASTHGLKPEATVQKVDSLQAASTLSGAVVDPASWPDADWWTQFRDPQLNELIAEGLTNRQIGERMFLAEKTVKNYVSNVLAKLGMSRRTEAAAYAARLSERKAREDRPN